MSLHDDELKIRAARLLAGTCGIDDLQRIYSLIRKRSYGKQSISQMCNMMGHPEGLNQGTLPNEIQKFIELFMFHWDNFNKVIRLDSLDPLFPNRLKYGSQYLTHRETMAIAGLGLSQTHKLIDEVIKRLKPHDDGTYYICDVSGDQFQAINLAINRWRSSPVPILTQPQIIRELTYALCRADVITKAQATLLSKRSRLLTLFVVYLMHRLEIRCSDGRVLHLSAGTISAKGEIGVWGTFGHQPAEGPIIFSVPIFLTDLKSAEYTCFPPSDLWQFPIQLDPAECTISILK